MGKTELQVRTKLRTDSLTNWTDNSPFNNRASSSRLLLGEPVVVVDDSSLNPTHGRIRLKIGDGSSVFSDLKYIDELLWENVDKLISFESSTNSRITVTENLLGIKQNTIDTTTSTVVYKKDLSNLVNNLSTVTYKSNIVQALFKSMMTDIALSDSQLRPFLDYMTTNLVSQEYLDNMGIYSLSHLYDYLAKRDLSNVTTNVFRNGQIRDSVISFSNIEWSSFQNGWILDSYIANSTLSGAKIIDATIGLEKVSMSFITDLFADSITTDTLNSKYLEVNAANLTDATIHKLFVETGLVTNATIENAHITGVLDSVEINASSITGGTIMADRLFLTDKETGTYKLFDGSDKPVLGKLDGLVIAERTLTPDRIVTKSITTNELNSTQIVSDRAFINEFFANEAVVSTLVSQEAFINAISTNKVVVGAYDKAQGIVDNIYSPGTTTIDGSKITTESITANKLFVNDLTSLSANIAGFQIKGGNPIYPLLATIKSGSFIQNADGSWTLKGSVGFPQVPYIGDTVVFTFLYQALEDIVNLEITISGSYNGVNLNDKVISLQLLSPTSGDYSVLKKDCGVLQLTDSSGALKTPSLVTITITSDKLLNIEEMHVSGLVSDGRITYNTDSFATDDDSLYISNNGISLGKNFSVTNTGYAQMSSGKIAGFEINEKNLAYMDQDKHTAELVGEYKAFSRISTYNYSRLYLGAGTYDYFYFPSIEQGYIDCNDATFKEFVTFSTNMFGCYAKRFSTDYVDSSLIPTISSQEPTPNGYIKHTYDLGSNEQPWENIYGKNIYSVGDIIAGLGTDNQVSLLGVAEAIENIGNSSYIHKTIITTSVPASKNTVIAKFTVSKSGNYIMYFGFRASVSAGNSLSVYSTNEASIAYQASVYPGSVSMYGSAFKTCMNGMRIMTLTAGTTYYVYAYSTAAVTIDNVNWFYAYLLK